MAESLKTDDQVAKILRESLKLEEFYPGKMAAGDVADMFPRSELCLFRKGDYVIYQGDESKDLYVVCRGSVAITQTMGTAGAQLAVLTPGDVFGEIALVRDGERVASAIAEEDSRIFRIAQVDVKELLDSNPPLGERLMKLAEERTNS